MWYFLVIKLHRHLLCSLIIRKYNSQRGLLRRVFMQSDWKEQSASLLIPASLACMETLVRCSLSPEHLITMLECNEMIKRPESDLPQPLALTKTLLFFTLSSSWWARYVQAAGFALAISLNPVIWKFAACKQSCDCTAIAHKMMILSGITNWQGSQSNASSNIASLDSAAAMRTLLKAVLTAAAESREAILLLALLWIPCQLKGSLTRLLKLTTSCSHYFSSCTQLCFGKDHSWHGSVKQAGWNF